TNNYEIALKVPANTVATVYIPSSYNTLLDNNKHVDYLTANNFHTLELTDGYYFIKGIKTSN
nr:hypothetical protein [Mariniflexile sp.]